MSDQLPNKIPYYSRNKDREHSSGETVPFILWEHDKLPTEVWVKTDVGQTHGTWTQHYEVVLLTAKAKYIGQEEKLYDNGVLKDSLWHMETLEGGFEEEGEAKEFARRWMYDHSNPRPHKYRNFFICDECGSMDVETIELEEEYMLLCNDCGQEGRATSEDFPYTIKEAEVTRGDFEFEKIIE